MDHAAVEDRVFSFSREGARACSGLVVKEAETKLLVNGLLGRGWYLAIK